MVFLFVLFILIIKISIIKSYTFDSSIDNLLYVSNTSTLYAISSSYLHQLHWSTTNQSLLVLHRRVRLHSSLDNTENGVSIFLYETTHNLLIVCARSFIGRCIFYDGNDISRYYILNSDIETNYLGCLDGCYTFLSSTNIIRSALIGNRRERNGNILNSIIDFDAERSNFNIKYQFQSSDHTLITSLTFLSDNLTSIEYLYGFDHNQYTYYLLKSSRLARLCQASIAMPMTYEEIPLQSCQQNSTISTATFDSNYLYIIYDNLVCIYTMNDILQAFKSSEAHCQLGIGYRLGFIIDSEDIRPKCEKVDEENLIDMNECTWQPYRKNTYMDGTIAAVGKIFYQSLDNNEKINFIFVEENIVIIGINQQHVLKFIRTNQTKLHLVHRTIYDKQPLNSQYVIDNQHQSLIFAVGTELYRYSYNSCSLYDTCRSCIGSRRYDVLPCMWSNGKCSLSSNSFGSDRGCPPIIDQIQPMNASVNTERIQLIINGSFEGIEKNFIKVSIKFPSSNNQESFCIIDTIENHSLTCNLVLPKQAGEGMISIHIQPRKVLSVGDTDISGTIEYPESFHVYIPKAILVPDYGPAAGETKIRIQNLGFNMHSTMKVFLGKNECQISKYDYSTDGIECINQACMNDNERLELNIRVNDQLWQLEKTFFQCRANPVVLDWTPKTAIMSGGIKLLVSGQNLDVVQKPMMKSVYNVSNVEFITSCESISTSQMICLSPFIDRNMDLIPPFELNIWFIMDSMNIVPDQNMLMIVNDPIYYPFQDSIQRIDSTNIVPFQVNQKARMSFLLKLNLISTGF